MPLLPTLLETSVGAVFTAKAFKGSGLLSGLLHASPDDHHHSSRHADFSSFFGGKSAAEVATMAATASHAADVDMPTSHSDFLFGTPAAVTRPKVASRGASLADHVGGLISPFRLAPKLSMMAGVGAIGSAVVEVGMKQANKLDPFTDDQPEDPQGWTKVVPRGLKLFVLADIFSALVILRTLPLECDVPLRTWLAGGILLGFPVSQLVRKQVENRPSYQWYRMHVTRLRGGGDPANMKMEGLMLYDQLQQPADRIQELEEHQDGPYWFASFRERATLLTSYQLITHAQADPAFDPVCWTLEGSFDGVDWNVIDEMEGPEVPRARGAGTQIFDELMHLDEATSSFRTAFLLEVLSNAAAFAWLIAGTAWVSAGTDTCVDSAPHLWYTCYLIIVVVWSFLGTITVGLIISAVAMIILGVKGPG